MIDLSHTIEEGMITYPGLPGPHIEDLLSREESRSRYAEGTEFLISMITMCSNTGTYVDSPYHRFADGVDLAGLPLDRLANLPALTVNVSGNEERAIDRSHFLPYDVAGKAVLVYTGWDQHWRTEAYFTGHPYLTADAAAYLVDRGVFLVGIDSLNIDDIAGGERPAHSLLLGAGIPICEHMTHLDTLPSDGYRFSAVPAPVRGMGTLPVRAFAVID